MSRTLIGLAFITVCFMGRAHANTCSDHLLSKFDRLASVSWMPAVPQEKWQISTLDPHYQGEEFARSAYHLEQSGILRDLPIHYYSNEELGAARTQFRSGKLFRLNGDRLQSMNGMEYVMMPDGEILIMPHYSDPARGDYRLRHSSLCMGGPVAASGHISFNENGEVTRIDRSSGHYKPSRRQLRQFVNYLRGHGVDLSATEINSN